MTEIKTYPIMSWSTLNGIPYRDFVKSPDAFITGISVLSRDYSASSLYVSPTDVYPNIDYRDTVTYRNSFREQLPITVGPSTYFKQLPATCTVTPSIQAFAEKCLLSFAVSRGIGKIPYSSYTKDILMRYGNVGDLVKFTDNYFSSLQYEASSIFIADKGLAIKNAWVDNLRDISDQTAITTNYSRPYLLFDTRSLNEQDAVLEANLLVTLDVTKTVLNDDSINLYVYKTADDSTTNATFTPVLTELGVIGTRGAALLAGQEVSIPLGSLAVNKKGYTKLALISELEKNNTLPTGFNQFTFVNVKLQLRVDPGVKFLPGPVSYFKNTVSGTNTTLQWSAPIDNGGYPISAYLIKNMNTGEEFWTQPGTSSLVVTGLLPNVQYSFSIQAQNYLGLSSSPVISIVGIDGRTLVPGSVEGFSIQGRDQSVVLTWSPPLDYATTLQAPGGVVSGTSVNIDGYSVTNISTGEVKQISGSVHTAEFTGLDNTTDYTFKIQAFNAGGYGPSSFIVGRPIPIDPGSHPPEIPEIVALKVSGTNAAFLWKIPKSLTQLVPYTYEYFVKVTNTDAAGSDPTDPGVHWYYNVYEMGQWGGSLKIPNLVPNTRYRACVKSSNAYSESPWICTALFTVPGDGGSGGGGGTGGGGGGDGKVLVPLKYNYTYFYQAPIDLDRNSPNYNNFLYPENVTEDQSAYIQGEEVTFPIVVSLLSNKLYFNVNDTDYTLTLAPGLVLEYSNVVETLNAAVQNWPFRFILIGNKLVVETTEKGDGNFVNFDVNFEKLYDLGPTLFGTEPTFIPGSTIYLVQDHVPVAEYDKKNKKSLVEAKVNVNVFNKNVSKPVFWTKTQNKFALTLQNTSIQPNSVVVSYTDDNNNIVYLRDYLGDGYLYNRKKTFDAVGDPISWSYTTDSVTSSKLLGKIDYKTGIISDLVFFTENGVNSYKKAVIRSNVTWPVKVLTSSSLYFSVRGTRIIVPVPQNTTGYFPSALSTLLNNDATFTGAGLVASVVNSQLTVTNSSFGPTETLELDNLQVNNSCNKLIFGFRPILISPSRIFVSYAYTIEDTDPQHYIWYQTPHFLIKAKGTTGTFLTKAHLDYIVNKVKLIKPTTTVLDRVQFALTLNDEAVCSESLNIYLQTPPPPPDVCTITLGSLSVGVPATASTGMSFEVTASGPTCPWTVVSNDAWLTITSPTNNTGSAKIFFDVAENSGPPRNGTITVEGNTFTVIQASAGGCTFTLNPSSIYIPTGGVDTKHIIAVTTGPSCVWTVTTTDAWIRIPVSAGGTGNGSVTIAVMANAGATRTGTVTIGDQTLLVTQEGSTQLITPPYLKIGTMIPEPLTIIRTPTVIQQPGGGIIIVPPPIQDHSYDVRVTNPDEQYDLKTKYYTYQ